MEKSDNSLYSYPPRALIISHPRSGLHMLRCGLYLLEGGTDPYEYFNEHYNICYCHEFEDALSFVNYSDIKYILLLRNPHHLIVRMTLAPHILKTYADIAPEKLKLIHPDINIERAQDDSLSDEDRFGSFGFVEQRYANLLKLYDELPSWIPKQLVHFEDQLANPHTLFEVADFLNIKYSPETIDLTSIAEKTKEMYVKSNHFPAPPGCSGLPGDMHRNLERHWKEYMGAELYDKYLKRYEGVY